MRGVHRPFRWKLIDWFNLSLMKALTWHNFIHDWNCEQRSNLVQPDYAQRHNINSDIYEFWHDITNTYIRLFYCDSLDTTFMWIGIFYNSFQLMLVNYYNQLIQFMSIGLIFTYSIAISGNYMNMTNAIFLTPIY